MDTLVFRLHNLKERYPILWHLCQQPADGKHLVHTHAPKPNETIDTVMKFNLHYKEGSAVPIRYSDKRKVPSSNHDIPFFIDQIRNFMEVNVSIPKYLFGNNVLEVIAPPNDKTYSVNQLSPYSQINFSYKLMREVITKLIYSIAKHNYLGYDADGNKHGFDWADVEIARIDFAINQTFESKDEALKYLRYMAGVKKRHQHDGSTGRQIWYQDQTLFFPSDRYTVKIYHKGTEFEQIQSKHIMELNKERTRQAVKQGLDPQLLSSNVKYASTTVQQLQQYADRILRYEFTFRPGYMSYIFNRKMNKNWSKYWKSFKQIFDYLEKDVLNKKFLLAHKVKYFDQLGYEVPKELGMTTKYFVEDLFEEFFIGSGVWKNVSREFTDKEYKFFRVLRRFGIIERKDLKLWLGFMTKELNEVREFRMSCPEERNTMVREFFGKDKNVPLYTNNAVTRTPKKVRFSITVMTFMLTELEKFFNNFQLDTKPAHSEFLDKINKHNDVISSKMHLYLEAAELKKISKDFINPRTRRSLIEFHNLFSKFGPKKVLEQYKKTQYHRLLRLYKIITGNRNQVTGLQFGEVSKDFNQIYKGLHIELTKGYLLNFYNTAFGGHYVA